VLSRSEPSRPSVPTRTSRRFSATALILVADDPNIRTICSSVSLLFHIASLPAAGRTSHPRQHRHLGLACPSQHRTFPSRQPHTPWW
jgi:hypothetical protein